MKSAAHSIFHTFSAPYDLPPFLPGLALSSLVAAVATALAQFVPLGSGPILAILLGLVVASLATLGPFWTVGLSMTSSNFLRAAVMLLGAKLSLGLVLHQGARSIPIIVITLGGTLLAARLVGRRLGVSSRLRILVGVGTAICGGSAIGAVTPIVAATQVEVGYAVATIFLFNIVAVFTFPVLGHVLGLSQHTFGVFAGTAVNDLSSVVATANVYGSSALQTAVIVKLTRTLMIVPICIALARRYAPDAPGGDSQVIDPGPRGIRTRASSVLGLVPTFLLGFILLAGLNSLSVIPHTFSPALSETSTLLITIALAAVGLSIDLGELRSTGFKPVALGAVLWVLITTLSLATQAVGLQ